MSDTESLAYLSGFGTFGPKHILIANGIWIPVNGDPDQKNSQETTLRQKHLKVLCPRIRIIPRYELANCSVSARSALPPAHILIYVFSQTCHPHYLVDEISDPYTSLGMSIWPVCWANFRDRIHITEKVIKCCKYFHLLLQVSSAVNSDTRLASKNTASLDAFP